MSVKFRLRRTWYDEFRFEALVKIRSADNFIDLLETYRKNTFLIFLAWRLFEYIQSQSPPNNQHKMCGARKNSEDWNTGKLLRKLVLCPSRKTMYDKYWLRVNTRLLNRDSFISLIAARDKRNLDMIFLFIMKCNQEQKNQGIFASIFSFLL